MLQKYTSIAICYLLASSSIVVSATNSDDRTAELYNNNNANGISSSGRGNDERANERRSFLNLGRRHFDHRALLSNNNKQRQQDASDRSLQVDEATQLSEAQTVKEEAEQIMLSSSPEAQQAISQTISDIQSNPDLSPSEKEEMLKLLKVEATEIQSQVIEDELHMNSSKKKKMEKLNEEITNVEVVKDELDVAIQQVEEEVVKETLLKGTEGQTFNNNNLSQPTSADKKYPTKAPSTINIAGGGGGGAYMKTEEPSYSPSEPEPTMSPSPSGSSSGSSSHSPSPSHDALTTSKSGKSRGKSGKSGGKGKSGKSGGTKSHKMDPSSSPTMDSLQPTADTPSPSDDTPSPSDDDTPSPSVDTDSPTPAPNTPRPSDDSTKEPSHSPTGTPSHGPSDQPTGMPSHGPSMAPTTIRPTVPDGSTFYDGFEEGNTNFPNEPWSVSSSLDGMLGIGGGEIWDEGFDRRRLQDFPFERVLEEDDDEMPTMSPSPSGTYWWTYHPSTIWPPTDLPTTYPPTPKPTPNPTRRPPDPPQAFTRRPTTPPSSSPTEVPTGSPSKQPSSSPTVGPTSEPTSTPTSTPTSAPTPKEMNWAITNDMAYMSTQSIKSPNLSCGDGTANVTLSLNETFGPYPGNLSFWYYCEDSPSEGGLHWHVDGKMKGSSDDMMTGMWMMEDLMIESSGDVTWSYVYDCDGDMDMDTMDEAGTAYIDAVTFKPHLSPTGFPTSSPSHSPSHSPTHQPSSEPSHSPTHEPSHDSVAPSVDPLPDCPAKEDNCQPGGCEGACKGAIGQIGSGSCLGEEMTCVDLDGFVGTDSCKGPEACKNLIGKVGNDSCIFTHACQDSSTVEIGNNSCKGPDACKDLTSMTIGDDSCIYPHACQNSTKAEIGRKSCNGEEACKDNTADISDNSCLGRDACTMNKAKIGARSCQSGLKACFHNEKFIGDDSCTGPSVCENNKGTIGSRSCNGFMACTNNTGTIGDDSCNGYKACTNNVDDVNVTSSGVCMEGDIPESEACQVVPFDFDSDINLGCIDDEERGYSDIAVGDSICGKSSSIPGPDPEGDVDSYRLRHTGGPFSLVLDTNFPVYFLAIRHLNVYPDACDDAPTCLDLVTSGLLDGAPEPVIEPVKKSYNLAAGDYAIVLTLLDFLGGDGAFGCNSSNKAEYRLSIVEGRIDGVDEVIEDISECDMREDRSLTSIREEYASLAIPKNVLV